MRIFTSTILLSVFEPGLALKIFCLPTCKPISATVPFILPVKASLVIIAV